MTQRQLDCAVAGLTGESLRTIRERGFHISFRRAAQDLEPEDLVLALDCPGCGQPLVVDPSSQASGLVGCMRCDAEFPFAEDEIVATTSFPGKSIVAA